MLAQQARRLAHEVFELDALRRTDRERYEQRLVEAWAFLTGQMGLAQTLATRAVCLLRQVVAFDIASMLLAADPRSACYAIVRPGPSGIEGLRLDRAILHTRT